MEKEADDYFVQPYLYDVKKEENVNMNQHIQITSITIVTQEGFDICKEEFEISPRFLQVYLKEYISDLQDIVQGTPKSAQFIKLYRGVSKDFQASEIGFVIIFPFFMSTSIYP